MKISCSKCVHSRVDRNHNLWCLLQKEEAITRALTDKPFNTILYKIPDNIEECFETEEMIKIKNKTW